MADLNQTALVKFDLNKENSYSYGHLTSYQKAGTISEIGWSLKWPYSRNSGTIQNQIQAGHAENAPKYSFRDPKMNKKNSGEGALDPLTALLIPHPHSAHVASQFVRLQCSTCPPFSLPQTEILDPPLKDSELT